MATTPHPAASAGPRPRRTLAGPAPRARAFPASGCDASAPVIPGFAPDDRALRALVSGESAATPSVAADVGASASVSASAGAGTGAGAAADTREYADGHVRFALPAAWFPARAAAPRFTLYTVRTGEPGDSFTVFLGDVTPFRPRETGDFRLALGTAALRGNAFTEGTRRRVEALALLPCASPRYAYVSLDSESPERFARMVAALRTLRIDPSAHTTLAETPLDRTRDASAVAALTARDPLARELATRALAGTGLRAAYPLALTHPLADQALFGQYVTELAGARVEVWTRLAVREGAARAPEAFRALGDGSLARAITALTRQGCRAPSLVVAHDGLSARCAGESTEWRAAVADEHDPSALPAALAHLGHARATLSRWARESGPAPGFPARLCEGAVARVSAEANALFVTTEHCALVLEPHRETLRAAALRADCAQAPASEPWTAALRATARFDELRGAGGTYCSFALGWQGRSGWVIAAGDASSTSAPLASGPTLAVDRRAVGTAVAFLRDLMQFASQPTGEPPANTTPSVLRELGLDRAGSPTAAQTLRLFYARGGFEGAGVSAVLGARERSPDQIEVSFVPVTVTLERRTGHWVVTAVRATEYAPAGARP